jgi:DNA-binding MarR family transcriptional regulator
MAAVPTIKQLRYLIALSETLSFTKAAERCFVGQSTLSAGLKELEDTLGTQLVERDKHSVSLTPTGRGVVERAHRLIAQADDLVDFVYDEDLRKSIEIMGLEKMPGGEITWDFSKTTGGLIKSDLIINHEGKIVSLCKSVTEKKIYRFEQVNLLKAIKNQIV